MNDPLRVVVLDCDGVILESVDIKTRAFAASVGDYGERAAAWLTEHHLRYGGVSRHEKYKAFFREYLGRAPEPGEADRLAERFRDAAVEEVKRAPLVPGVQAFLDWAAGRVPLYVASGAPQDELRFLLELRGLSKFFCGVFGSPDTKPVILGRILAEHGVAASQLLMVGDSGTDLEAARSVGARFFGRGPFEGQPHAKDLAGLVDWVRVRLPGA